MAGGSGYVEATVRDMGFPEDKTEGAKGAEPSVAKRTRKSRKSKEEGGAILGLAEIETDPPGDPSLKAPLALGAPSSRKMNTQKKVVAQEEMPAARPVGGARTMNKCRALIKDIMDKHQMKLPEAAKYIKENKLYNKDARVALARTQTRCAQ